MIFYAVAFLLILLYAGIILYYRSGWLQIKPFTALKALNSDQLTSVSVIVVARNEEKNIGECISSILNQTYPEGAFEIIVVDDHSTDTTMDIVLSFEKNNIKIIQLADYSGGTQLNSYKKLGIKKAIDVATGHLIVTTDADCTVPTTWLETLTAFYTQTNSVFMAAPVVYVNPSPADPLSKKIFKIFQSLDFMTLQGITGASINKRFHNMCNGANLAYVKTVFEQVNGFEGIDNIASGDDMLLMHKIQKVYPDKIGFLKSRNAMVKTQPVNTLKEFFFQRIRWASKAGKYKDPKITGVLFLVYIFNVWLFIAGIYSFFSLTSFYLFITLLLTKIIIELIFLFPVAKFFDKRRLLLAFIPAQPFHIPYIIIAGWLGKFGSYRWKGRKVK
jgi:glycosyltransferase involved in cell wall biosynthesis